jgi:hypothetical protein
MGSNLFSTAYAARVADVKHDLLESWLKSGVFETEHFAKNTKTQEKTFYFAPADLSRLAEFAAKEARKSRTSGIRPYGFAGGLENGRRECA